MGLTLLLDLNLGVENSSTSEKPLRNQRRRWPEVLETEATLFGEERLLEEQTRGGGCGGVARYANGSRGRHDWASEKKKKSERESLRMISESSPSDTDKHISF